MSKDFKYNFRPAYIEPSPGATRFLDESATLTQEIWDSYFARFNEILPEAEKVKQDAATFGSGYMLDGKHVPVHDPLIIGIDWAKPDE